MQWPSKHPGAESGLNIDDSCLKNNVDSMKKWEKLVEKFVTRILNVAKKEHTAGNASSAEDRTHSLSLADWDEFQKRHGGLTLIQKKFSECFGDHPTCYMGNYNSTLTDRETLK